MMIVWTILGLVTAISIAILSISIALASYSLTKETKSGEPQPLLEERIMAYREIMGAIISMNRTAVAMGEEEFEEQARLLALDKDSELQESYEEVNIAYQKYFYIIDKEVQKSVSNYVNYSATHHRDGAEVDQLLVLTGEVSESIRYSLELPKLFEHFGSEEER